MFFRQKKSGPRTYLQIVENRWENGATRQRVVATLGRLDQLQQSGQLEGLLRSGARFAEAAMVTELGVDLRVLKNSSDALGHVYGCQENYEATVASGVWLLV